MCYDISFTVKLKELPAYFPDLETDLQLSFDFEGIHIMGHSHHLHPVVFREREDKKYHLRAMEWGVIPFYIKDENSFLRQRASMLNTRSERILADEKSYWYKIRNRRCLIPVNGVYEHRTVKGWKKKVPYFIRLKDQPQFFLPGLYSIAELPDLQTGEMLRRYTFSIITRNANERMKQIHNDGDNRWRMPLFLPLDLSIKFLEEELSVEQYELILQYEMPSEYLDAIPVYTIRSAKPRPDGKGKNEFWDWGELPALGTDD